MNRRDPLEPLFELLKAYSAELAPASNLENKLMDQFQKQKQPRRWKKVGIIAAVFCALVLAGGGIAKATGYNLFGTVATIGLFDEHGNEHQFNVVNSVQNADGTMTMEIEMDGHNAPGIGVFVPAGDK